MTRHQEGRRIGLRIFCTAARSRAAGCSDRRGERRALGASMLCRPLEGGHPAQAHPVQDPHPPAAVPGAPGAAVGKPAALSHPDGDGPDQQSRPASMAGDRSSWVGDDEIPAAMSPAARPRSCLSKDPVRCSRPAACPLSKHPGPAGPVFRGETRSSQLSTVGVSNRNAHDDEVHRTPAARSITPPVAGGGRFLVLISVGTFGKRWPHHFIPTTPGASRRATPYAEGKSRRRAARWWGPPPTTCHPRWAPPDRRRKRKDQR